MDIGGIWDGWSDDEKALFDDALGNLSDELGARVAEDEWVQFLYHEAMWDFDIRADYRQGAYDAFVEYMENTYDIEWEEIYDWDAYREAYDTAA